MLQSQSPFRLSHIAIKEASRCTSQLRTGIFFVTDEPITPEQLEEFDGPLATLREQLKASR